MSQNSCCVPGCSNTRKDGVPLHRFPNPESNAEQFNIWITNIGGELSNLDITTVYDNRRVCHIHFEDVYKYPKNRLSKIATPVLHLSEKQVQRFDSFQDVNREGPSLLNPDDIQGNMEVLRNPIAEHQISQEKETLYQDDIKSRDQKKRRKIFKGSSVSLLQQRKYKAALNQLRKCEAENRNMKRKLIAAKKVMKTVAFQVISKHMSLSTKILCQMQVTQSRKKKKGRRFTLDEKILALSLYKPSPKAYRLLSKLCVMPSRRTLQNLLHKINLKAGINKIIFENLKDRVSKMPESHKYCSLLFDEMAIGPGISYDKKNDKLKGFVDNGVEAKKEFCDHVLVFMVRGIFKKYKQPLAYYFCSGSTKTIDLKNQIAAIIVQLQCVGLEVVATVCDQGASNVAAINCLIKQTKEIYLRKMETCPEGVIEINGKQIFPIFDPPHLIKGIRNNLLTKNLTYKMDGKDKTAKWSHIVALYNKCPVYQGVKLVPKLTAQHVLPALIPKMRVKNCTQVFSKSVGGAIGCMAELGVIDKESTETADILIFFDNLFDSVNGSYSEVKGGKIYRSAVTPTSPHHKLWDNNLKILKTMKFVNAYNQGVVPSLSSWIKTIENFKKIVKYMYKKGITSLLLRNINQDALENFFGSIRAHGCSNIMPTSSAFEGAFKTLLLNNISSPHSVGSNCEKDDSFCLQTLKKYLTIPASDETTECVGEIDSTHLSMALLNTDDLLKSTTSNNIEKSVAIGYCSGWIAQQAKKNIFKICLNCKKDLETDEEQIFHKFIKKKEFDNKKWLCYPTRQLFDLFAQIENISIVVLETQCDRNNILTYLRLIVNININVSFLNCNTHKEELSKYLINKITQFVLHNWCKEINEILSGKTLQSVINVGMKEKAFRHYSRNKGRKKCKKN